MRSRMPFTLSTLRLRCSPWSVTAVVLLWVLINASSCGVNPLCDRLADSSNRFFGGKVDELVCRSGEEGLPEIGGWGFSRFNNNNCTNGFNKCSAAETKSITSYVECLEAAPACTEGNEKAAVLAIDACVKALPKNINPECMVALE